MDYDYNDYNEDEEKEKAVKAAPPEGGEAVAVGRIAMHEAAFQAFINDENEIWTKARHTGTLAATGTESIMITGRSVNISGIELTIDTNDVENFITVTCLVKTVERMRAEGPALLGCGCALISIIDKLRLMDREIKIESLGLQAK